MKMDITDLKWLAGRFPDATLGDLDRLLSDRPQTNDSAWVLGQAYHIRTVTHYWTGRLIQVTPMELVLEDAAWIPDDGRFSDFFNEGPNECEPIDGPTIIGRGAVVDAQLMTIALPRTRK